MNKIKPLKKAQNNKNRKQKKTVFVAFINPNPIVFLFDRFFVKFYFFYRKVVFIKGKHPL